MLDGEVHNRTVNALTLAAGGGLFSGYALAQGPLLSLWTVVATLVLLLTALISMEMLPSAEEIAITWREHQDLNSDGGQR